jgi:hypothetical protein
MALFFECMQLCALKVLDTADIVRDAMLRQLWFPLSTQIHFPAVQTRKFQMKFRSRHDATRHRRAVSAGSWVPRGPPRMTFVTGPAARVLWVMVME